LGRKLKSILRFAGTLRLAFARHSGAPHDAANNRGLLHPQPDGRFWQRPEAGGWSHQWVNGTSHRFLLLYPDLILIPFGPKQHAVVTRLSAMADRSVGVAAMVELANNVRHGAIQLKASCWPQSNP